MTHFEIKQNSAGYWVIPLSKWQVSEIFNGAGICDYCGHEADDGFFCPVLGHKWYCTKCHADWENTAIMYPEDLPYELEILRAAVTLIIQKSHD